MAAESQSVDPTTLEIVSSNFGYIGGEMQSKVMNSAYSSMWQEAGDLSAALLSPDAEIIGQSERAIPIHVATMINSVQKCIELTGGPEALEPGDVLIQNDPYSGNNHLPDFVVAAPVFVNELLIGFSAVRAHWLDVGGSSPTSYDTNTGEIIKEGLRVPPAKLFEGGERNEALHTVILANVRDREERLGDFNAQLGGVKHGRERLGELAEKYGEETVSEAIAVLLSRDEARMRGRIEALPDGSYSAEDYLDGDGVEDTMLEIRAEVSIGGDEIEVDFTGSDGDVFGGINAPPSVTEAATHYAVKCTLNPGHLRTSGEFRPIRIVTETGTIVNPEYPAPVVAGNHETANRVFDTVVAAIEKVDPELVFGAGEGSTNGLTYRSLESKQTNRTRGLGGMGACPHRDGIHAIRSGVGNTGVEPVERFEEKYDFVTISEFSLVEDTGGAGRYRGGNTSRLVTRLADESEIIITSERSKTRPYGVAGGRPGSSALHVHVAPSGQERTLPSKIKTNVEAGSEILLQPAGGGGYGDPTDRPPERVLEDFLDGYISRAAAEEEYGVMIDRETTSIDWEATAALREP